MNGLKIGQDVSLSYVARARKKKRGARSAEKDNVDEMNVNLANSTTTNSLFTLDLFNPALSYATVLSFIATVLAVGGSVGGGGMQIAIYLICFKFDTSSTQALSRTVVASVTFVVFLHTCWYRHPNTPRPMIDYDLTLLMAPAGVLGSTWGVVLNGFLSDYVILICMISIMILSFCLTFKRAILLHRKEKKEKKENEGKNPEDRVEAGGVNPNPGLFDFSEVFLFFLVVPLFFFSSCSFRSCFGIFVFFFLWYLPNSRKLF